MLLVQARLKPGGGRAGNFFLFLLSSKSNHKHAHVQGLLTICRQTEERGAHLRQLNVGESFSGPSSLQNANFLSTTEM